MRLHGSPVAHVIAIAIACSACSSGDRPPAGPPPLSPVDGAVVADPEADWPASTADGPRVIPARAGDHPCPPDRCWTSGTDGKPKDCLLPGGPTVGPDPQNNLSDGTCGGGGTQCSICRCAAADTPVATPGGEVAIAELAVGDLVMSMHEGTLQAVPVIAVRRVAVADHTMVTVTLDDGRRVSMSPLHPTGDGGVFADLVAGARLGDARIVAVAREPYAGGFTHDILPDSDTGTYVTAGALVGSTLFQP